jgi:hypothetical protein
MDNNEKLYKKYLKYKEKYLFLQQIAAGYQKQKDFTQKIAHQESKIGNINASLGSTKEQLKSAIASEMSALNEFNKNVNDKTALKHLNTEKSKTHNLKKKLETIEKTLVAANSQLHNLVIQQRDSREKIAENNLNYAKKIVQQKKKIIEKIQKKIEKLNIQVKKSEADLVVAQQKETEAAAKLDEMKNALDQVEREELNRLGGVVNTYPAPVAQQPTETSAQSQ